MRGLRRRRMRRLPPAEHARLAPWRRSRALPRTPGLLALDLASQRSRVLYRTALCGASPITPLARWAKAN